MQNNTNVNLSQCIVQRTHLRGISYTNICTGSSTYLEYTKFQYAQGGLIILFILFCLWLILSMFKKLD
jgi:hypothetical protein